MSNTDSGHGPSEEGDHRNLVSTFSDPLAQCYQTFDSVRNSFKMQPPCYRSVCSSPCVVVQGCSPGDGTDPCRPFSRQFGRVGGCSNSKQEYPPEVFVSHRQNCSCGTDCHSVHKLNHKCVNVNDSPYNDVVQRPPNLSVKFQNCDIGDSTSRADDTDTNVTDDDSSSCTSGSYTVGIEGDDAVSVSVDV